MEKYLQDNYDITNENKVEILESVLAYYFCNWQLFRENLMLSNINPENFLADIDRCKTTGEIKALVNNFI